MKRFAGQMTLLTLFGVFSLIVCVRTAVADLSIDEGDFVDTISYNLRAGAGNGSVNGVSSGSGGVFKWRGTNTTTNLTDDFYAVCIETTQNTNADTIYEAVLAKDAPNSAPMGVAAADKIGWLYFNLFDTTGTLNALYSSGINDLKELYDSGTASQRGALQLATWALVYGLSISGSGTEVTNANAYLTAVNAANTAGWSQNVLALIAPNAENPTPTNRQDMLIYTPTGAPNVDPVPEPTTIVIWGLIGAIGCVVGRRQLKVIRG